MRSVLIRIGIVAAIVVVGLVARSFTSGNVGDLKVGDCIDLPTGVQTVKDLQHHPCTDAHDGEVFWTGTLDGFTTLPTEDQVRNVSADKCAPALVTYAGIDIFSDATYDVGWFSPTSDGWASGDRGLICYVYRVDEARMTAPVKKG